MNEGEKMENGSKVEIDYVRGKRTLEGGENTGINMENRK